MASDQWSAASGQLAAGRTLAGEIARGTQRRRRNRIGAAAIAISIGLHAAALGGIVAVGGIAALLQWRGGRPAAGDEGKLPQVLVEPLSDAALTPSPMSKTFVPPPDLLTPRLPPLPAPREAPAAAAAERLPVEMLGTLSLVWEADPGRPQVAASLPAARETEAQPAAATTLPAAARADSSPGGNGSLSNNNDGPKAPRGSGNGDASGMPAGDISKPGLSGVGPGGAGVPHAGGPRPGGEGIQDGGPPIPHAGNRAPAYPLASRQRGEEGIVRVRLTIGRDGNVADAVVAASSGHPALDAAALEAVRSWRFNASAGERMAEQDIRFFIQR